MAQSVTAKRRLVLHFDLNNTILMQDMSKGLNTIENVARIVCKSAWGRLISNKLKNEKTYTWELAHDQLTFSKPDSLNLLANLPSTDAKDVQIATYMDYIDAAYPNLVGTESSEEKAEREEIRKKLRIKFSQPGGAGSKFKNTYEKIIKQLALPKGAKDELGISGENGMEPEMEIPASKGQDGDQSEDEDKKKER